MILFGRDIWTSFIKKIPLFLLIVLVSAIVGVILLTSLFTFFPNVPDKYVVASAKSFENVPSRQELFSWCTSELDNWTDALILQISSDNTDATNLNRALLAYHGANTDNNGSPVDSFCEHHLSGRSYDITDTYARYWHGYLLFIRPLLYIMPYSAIRIVNGLLQLTLNLLIIYLLYEKNLVFCIIPYILSVLMLMPIAQAMSLQFSSCFYIFMFGVIALLLCNNQKWYSFIFLAIGIATAYFDFLTYPIATFGIPAVIALSLNKDNRFSYLFILLGSWSLGYGGMWACKWIFTELLTNQSIISNVKLAISERTSSSAPNGALTTFSVLKDNLSYFFHTPVTLASIVFLIILALSFIRKKEKHLYGTILLPYIFVSLLPIIWFIFTKNHSYIHSFYTNKGCVVLFFAILTVANRYFLLHPEAFTYRFICKERNI